MPWLLRAFYDVDVLMTLNTSVPISPSCLKTVAQSVLSYFICIFLHGAEKIMPFKHTDAGEQLPSTEGKVIHHHVLFHFTLF